MNKNTILEQKQALEELLGSGKFAEGYGLCQELLVEIEKLPADEMDRDVCKEIGQMYAVLVIELGKKEEQPRAMTVLEGNGLDPYSVFIQSRLYWLVEDNFQTLALLEDYFKITSSEADFVIDGASPFWQASNTLKQKILNILGRVYKFYGLPMLGAKCGLMASELGEDLPARRMEYSNYLFDLHYLFMEPEDYFQAHSRFDSLFADVKQLSHDVAVHQVHRKIRIGYISSDFRHHVCLLFCWAMLTQYNRDEFEVYVFHNGQVEDDYSKYIKNHVNCWCNVSSYSPQVAANVIKSMEIDILFELAGHSCGNALSILAYKPAPIQICGIGYFATTGLKAVDYFLTDKYLVNENTQKYFTEKLLVLPYSHFCYTPLNDMPVATKGAPCVERGYITFGSFNNLTKVNDQVLAAWVEILRRVPNSRLLLKGNLLSNPEGRELMRQKLLALGLSEERFELQAFTLPYLSEYYNVDIALDTFPYPGGGTTCDALYMGVPVVTLGDGSHGGNFGISLLKNIGLEECCTYSVAEYIDRAVLLAGEFQLLDALHKGIRYMMDKSTVIDGRLYMKDLEQAYREIFAKYLAKN